MRALSQEASDHFVQVTSRPPVPGASAAGQMPDQKAARRDSLPSSFETNLATGPPALDVSVKALEAKLAELLPNQFSTFAC